MASRLPRRIASRVLLAALTGLAPLPGIASPPARRAAVVVGDVRVDAPPIAFAPDAAKKLTLHRYLAAGPEAEPARLALLLLPCEACGAGWLDPLARDLASRGGLAVFTLDHRGVALEDRGKLDRLRAEGTGEAAQDAIAHYLGGDGKPPAWEFPGGEKFRYMVLWGSSLMHEDIRAAVREVSRLTSVPVVAGGFLAGATSALGFAARKFPDGRAGYEEIAGLILLDGAARMESADDQAGLNRRLDDWTKGLDLGGGFWDMRREQIRTEIAALLALRSPAARSPLAEGAPEPLRGAALTNAAAFGLTLDFGPAGARGFLASIYQPQMGTIDPAASAGALTRWADGGSTVEPTRLAQVAAAARAPGGLFDWYYPSRLVKEENEILAAGFAQPSFGVTELDRIAVPIFTVTTAATAIDGASRPPSGAWLFQRIPAKGCEAYTIPEMRHADVLFADLARDRVFEPLYRWLMKIRPASLAIEPSPARP